MTPEAIEKEANAPRERWCWFHWQNLNEKWPKGIERSERRGEPKLGWGLREGRCWWHFRSKDRCPGNTIRFEWNLWSHFCGIGFAIDDEDLTFHLSFPPVAFWLSPAGAEESFECGHLSRCDRGRRAGMLGQDPRWQRLDQAMGRR